MQSKLLTRPDPADHVRFAEGAVIVGGGNHRAGFASLDLHQRPVADVRQGLRRADDPLHVFGENGHRDSSKAPAIYWLHGMANRTFTSEDARRIGEAIGIDWTSAPFDLDQFQAGLAVELEHGAH